MSIVVRVPETCFNQVDMDMKHSDKEKTIMKEEVILTRHGRHGCHAGPPGKHQG